MGLVRVYTGARRIHKILYYQDRHCIEQFFEVVITITQAYSQSYMDWDGIGLCLHEMVSIYTRSCMLCQKKRKEQSNEVTLCKILQYRVLFLHRSVSIVVHMRWFEFTRDYIYCVRRKRGIKLIKKVPARFSSTGYCPYIKQFRSCSCSLRFWNF